jgi:hypothetical protein
MSALPDPFASDVYRTIAARLAAFDPAIQIWQHIDRMLDVGRNTLHGITFKAKDVDKLLLAFRSAKDTDGLKAFAEGSKLDPRHWALRLSYKETNGIGFREIWRPRFSDRPLRLEDAEPNRFRPTWSKAMDAKFNDPTDDGSAIHGAVAADYCNVHIDDRGFVMTGPDGGVVVDPDFAQHLVNELWFRTKLDHKLPDWLIDRFSIVLPNSSNEYSRVGASFDLVQQKSYKVRVTGSCSILGPCDFTTTLSISGKY